MWDADSLVAAAREALDEAYALGAVSSGDGFKLTALYRDGVDEPELSIDVDDEIH